jgi:hypothetical protein
MFEKLLAEQKKAFDAVQKEFDEAAKKYQEGFDAAKKTYLKEAAKYKYFDDDELLKSPPVNRAYFSDRTAWVMASMAQLAYQEFEKDETSLGLFVSKLDSGGFTLVDTFSVGGTQAFLAYNKIYAVLAFRGTSDWKDVQTDATANRKPTPDGKVHAGFYQAYVDVAGTIKDKLKIPEVKDLPLYITGHSLGGALATVATQDLEKSGLKDHIAACYTFGSPRVGNADFDKTIRSPVYRVINFTDIVTFLPLLTMGYIHVGDVRYLDYGFPDLVLRWRPLSQRLFLLVHIIMFLYPAIKQHGIQNYIDKLERIALGQNVDLMMTIAMKENQQRER